MIKNGIRWAARPSIGFVHAMVATIWVLVLGTGTLTFVSNVVWLAVCIAVDQVMVWALWAAGGRSEPGPNRGWF